MTPEEAARQLQGPFNGLLSQEYLVTIPGFIIFGLICVALTIVVISVIVPDNWSTWLGTRKNLPIVLQWIGITFLVILGVQFVLTLVPNLIILLATIFYANSANTLFGVLIVCVFLIFAFRKIGQMRSARKVARGHGVVVGPPAQPTTTNVDDEAHE